MNSSDSILQSAVDFYIKSSDFNGITLRELLKTSLMTWEDFKEVVENLVSSQQVILNKDINPHILRMSPEDIPTQISWLLEENIDEICVYPTPHILKKKVRATKYRGRPFTLRLARGEPQLIFQSFELSVLESYRNDPRYYYKNNDISGSIYIRDDASVPEHDQILLQTFGFSFDKDLNRAVAVYLRYLSDLSPEHQQIWHSKLVQNYDRLHPEYFRSSILGDWHTAISIFDAVLGEIRTINQLCGLMGRSKIFREEFQDDKRPENFGFLLRPTLKEFNDFINTLDKIMSENIERDFFMKEVPYESETTREDGKTIVTPKGTIQILENWLTIKFQTPDPNLIGDIVNPFKEVRKLRQNPAHKAQQNVFDNQFSKAQRELMIRVWQGMNTLRQVFHKHPTTAKYKVDIWLDGDVLPY